MDGYQEWKHSGAGQSVSGTNPIVEDDELQRWADDGGFVPPDPADIED